MNRGFFTQVARYAAPAGPDQSENRLTGIFAAVLRRVPGLPQALVTTWLDTAVGAGHSSAARLSNLSTVLNGPGGERCTVQPWPTTGSGKHPDLQLEFGVGGVPEDPGVTVWVEIKHGSPPHEGQLPTYLDEVPGPSGLVVLLEPRQRTPFVQRQQPADVVAVSWQQTAVALRSCADGIPDSVAGFLIDELCRYLQEENLMDPERVSPAHLIALAEWSDAQLAVTAACDIAADYVAPRWTALGHHGAPLSSPEASWAYKPEPGGGVAKDWSPWHLGWSLLKNGHFYFPALKRAGPCFIAGINTMGNPGSLQALRDAVEWRARLPLDPAFEFFGDKNANLRRYAYPEEILSGRSLQQQGRALGAWIDEAFCALYDVGPPPGVELDTSG